MNCPSVRYDKGTADRDAIYTHLMLCGPHFSPPLDSYTDIHDYSTKIARNALTFEAWSGSTLVGLAAAYLNDSASRSGFITNVSVLRTFWGKGIASRLLEAVIEQAKLDGYHSLRLQVFTHNAVATRLYSNFGFACEAVNEGTQAHMYLCLTRD